VELICGALIEGKGWEFLRLRIVSLSRRSVDGKVEDGGKDLWKR